MAGSPTVSEPHELGAGQLTQVRFDHAVTLQFADGALLTIEAPLSLTDEHGETTASPDDWAPVAPDLIAALHGHANATVVGLQLRVSLGVSVTLTVAPDANFEAWNHVGADGRRVVSTPGGELATFEADPR